MANACYVTIQGSKQGKFKAEPSFSKFGSDKITAVRFSYPVTAPHDVATGQPSGKRQHGTVKFTKENGAATPQLFEALVSNEALTSVVFEFTRSSAGGKEEVHYVITLTNATLVAVVATFDQTVRGNPFDGHELVDVELTFEKISVEDKIGQTEAEDDWVAQV
jgi:type VI secretion system secreted protein Hcp